MRHGRPVFPHTLLPSHSLTSTASSALNRRSADTSCARCVRHARRRSRCLGLHDNTVVGHEPPPRDSTKPAAQCMRHLECSGPVCVVAAHLHPWARPSLPCTPCPPKTSPPPPLAPP